MANMQVQRHTIKTILITWIWSGVSGDDGLGCVDGCDAVNSVDVVAEEDVVDDGIGNEGFAGNDDRGFGEDGVAGNDGKYSVSGDDESVASDEGASSVDDVGIDESATCTGDATEDDGDVGESVSVEKVCAGNEGVPEDHIVDIDRVIDDEVLSVGWDVSGDEGVFRDEDVVGNDGVVWAKSVVSLS